jgi:hypothetical protein
VSEDGASYWRADVAEQDFTIRYFNMTIEGLEEWRFVVAKLRRVSSPPVQVGTVSDSMASALGRLLDIIWLGKESRNYADLKAVEWALAPEFMVSAEVEWAEYERVACRVLEVERPGPRILGVSHRVLEMRRHLLASQEV